MHLRSLHLAPVLPGILLLATSPVLHLAAAGPADEVPSPSGQSLVFFHPDGAGLAGWNLYRILDYGPDGHSEWDLLPGLGVYRGHMRNNLNASSHGGATTHAYGIKVLRDSFGMNGTQEIVSARGFPGSVMDEARAAGMAVGIVNSGHLAEPGTACMLASVPSRGERTAIAAQLVESGADLILGGGEVLFLPEGTRGVHGVEGVREDGRNLVEEARQAGYTVIYEASELEALSRDDENVLGLFAAENTYHALPEEELESEGKPLYLEHAPTVAEMTRAALKWLSSGHRPYFLMVEEEGTDNFANAMNASGTMEAFRRADAVIGVARKHVEADADLTLIVAADSEAGSPALISRGVADAPLKEEALPRLPVTTMAGAPLDGVGGTGTRPFVSGRDRFGQRHLFGIAWIDGGDHFGSILVRAAGSRAGDLPPNVDNTEIHRFIREVIFE